MPCASPYTCIWIFQGWFDELERNTRKLETFRTQIRYFNFRSSWKVFLWNNVWNVFCKFCNYCAPANLVVFPREAICDSLRIYFVWISNPSPQKKQEDKVQYNAKKMNRKSAISKKKLWQIWAVLKLNGLFYILSPPRHSILCEIPNNNKN